jgi:hypothetical protein
MLLSCVVHWAMVHLHWQSVVATCAVACSCMAQLVMIHSYMAEIRMHFSFLLYLPNHPHSPIPFIPDTDYSLLKAVPSSYL